VTSIGRRKIAGCGTLRIGRGARRETTAKIMFEKLVFHDKKVNCDGSQIFKLFHRCAVGENTMVEKIYITSKQMATFVCPKCRNTKRVNVSKYAALDKVVKVNVKCPCGYAYTSILEKRKKYRKETRLHGTYIRIVDGREVHSGLMTVKDLSLNGMKLVINNDHGCVPGDVILVEFRLDDTQRSLVRKKVIIRNINGSEIGTELAPTESIDKALGFYLFS
jgi:hypothetical protein